LERSKRKHLKKATKSAANLAENHEKRLENEGKRIVAPGDNKCDQNVKNPEEIADV